MTATDPPDVLTATGLDLSDMTASDPSDDLSYLTATDPLAVLTATELDFSNLAAPDPSEVLNTTDPNPFDCY